MKIGVIGSGFIVDVFVKGMKAYKDVELYAIWGRHEEKIKQFKSFKKYYTNIDDFYNDENIDVVYVAVPNSLHYEYSLKALKSNKHVLCEKPFCQTYKQAKTLIDYAKKNKLLLFETIMTKHARNYKQIQKLVDKLGSIKMVEANYSQYSRRYDKFKNGLTLPAFDYKMAGGALMDLGVYNIHFVSGIFGMPSKISYYPNIEKNVDTSGVLILDYKKFKATLVACKDCKVDSYALIQGDKGYIRLNTTTSRCASYSIVLNDGYRKDVQDKDLSEFAGWKTLYDEFMKLYKKKDYKTCYEYLKQTLIVQKILDGARSSAKMKF